MSRLYRPVRLLRSRRARILMDKRKPLRRPLVTKHLLLGECYAVGGHERLQLSPRF